MTTNLWGPKPRAHRRLRGFAARTAAAGPSMARSLFTERIHPWFDGYRKGSHYPAHAGSGLSGAGDSKSYMPPILFLARGHSGTTALAKILEASGVFMGNRSDPHCLNSTTDALYWTYGLQRTLVPRLWNWGSGCDTEIGLQSVYEIGFQCLARHLYGYRGGRWGAKTCAGMFAYEMYDMLFPEAKYIHLIRDGRDVTLSKGGHFHMTQEVSRYFHYEYFKILTFGMSDDITSAPFQVPEEPHWGDAVMKNRYWIQAKSWGEHLKRVEQLESSGRLAGSCITIKYEDLCSKPQGTLQQLFSYLDLELTDKVIDYAVRNLHSKSIGRWNNYKERVFDTSENIAEIFSSMEPLLERYGYDT